MRSGTCSGTGAAMLLSLLRVVIGYPVWAVLFAFLVVSGLVLRLCGYRPRR